MDLGKYIEQKRIEKKVERKALAYALSISYSKLQNIEKGYKTFDLSDEEMKIICQELDLNDYEVEALNWYYKTSNKLEPYTLNLLMQNKRSCEVLLSREDFSIYFDEIVREMIYDFFYEKVINQEGGFAVTIGNYSIIAWAILLNLPKLLDNCIYHSKEKININESYSIKGSISEILAYSDSKNLNTFLSIFKKHEAKIFPDIKPLYSILPTGDDYNPYSPVQEIVNIENNELKTEIIDYIKIPEYLRNIKNLNVFQVNYDLLFTAAQFRKSENIPPVPNKSHVFVEVGAFPEFDEQLGLFIYQNRIIARKYKKYDNIYIFRPYNTFQDDIVLNSNKDDFKLIGRILKFEALY